MKSTILALITFVLLAGCEVRDGNGERVARNSSSPIYGPVKPLRGFYSSGFEQSAFSPCSSARGKCKIPIAWNDPFIGFCWAEFTRSSNFNERPLDRKPNLIWLEGEGRVTIGEGRYGHMGAYRCQIEIRQVRLVDDSDQGEVYEAVPVR